MTAAGQEVQTWMSKYALLFVLAIIENPGRVSGLKIKAKSYIRKIIALTHWARPVWGRLGAGK